jgi:hypothetical protein
VFHIVDILVRSALSLDSTFGKSEVTLNVLATIQKLKPWGFFDLDNVQNWLAFNGHSSIQKLKISVKNWGNWDTEPLRLSEISEFRLMHHRKRRQ